MSAFDSQMPRRQRIRVGFDARWYNDSGVGSYVAGLLSAMVQMSNEVELLVYEDPTNPLPLPVNSQAQRIAIKAKRYSPAGQIELAQVCRQHRLDVFHSPFYVVPLLARCRVVVTIHDLIPFLFPIYSSIKRFMVRGGYRMAVRKADHIIADSNHTARDIERILGIESNRISVVHLAAQECYKPEGESHELNLLMEKYGVRPPYVLLPSARNWQTKNLKTALEVLRAAKEQSGARFQTVVFGPPEGVEAVGNEESRRCVNLHYAGYVPTSELARLYRNANLLLLPSLYEGFGLPLVEAMSCGCAVVCSDGGALAEIAGNGAQVFNPADISGMANAIADLMCDEGKVRRWREAALRRSLEFSWRKAARETISVYDRTHKSGFLAERHSVAGEKDGLI